MNEKADTPTVRPFPGTEDPTLAGRYLAGQLSATESEAYEARFLLDPEIVNELEATARFKVGLQRLRQSGELDELMGQRTWTAPPLALALALAAALAVVAIGVNLWYPRTPSERGLVLSASLSALHDTSGRGLAVLVTQSMVRTRASAYDAVIALPLQRGAVELQVQPTEPEPGAHYQARLARLRDDDSTDTVATLTHLSPSPEGGFVSVYADSSLLAPGRYRLTLSREDVKSPSGADAFTIKVTAAPTP
ncbi:MAG TPA: hypothetical protein VMT29_01495 [Steroidobacteraceae bacterium]|nr:hypothetical protein [Steroidobacteraceae bacterium]